VEGWAEGQLTEGRQKSIGHSLTILVPFCFPRIPAGKVEKKEHILDERDTLFVDLRHKHFAAASLQISNQLDEFRARNAKVSGRSKASGELEMRNMSRLIQSLPQYR
jgi:hypothetical protein